MSDLDSERWKQVERLYHRVLDSPPDQRAALLGESCAADPDLRREVESLLEAREDAGAFLSSGNLSPHLATLHAAAESPAPGSPIGPYEILAPLGSGGMGRSIARAIRVWSARWRSKSCLCNSRTTPPASPASDDLLSSAASFLPLYGKKQESRQKCARNLSEKSGAPAVPHIVQSGALSRLAQPKPRQGRAH